MNWDIPSYYFDQRGNSVYDGWVNHVICIVWFQQWIWHHSVLLEHTHSLEKGLMAWGKRALQRRSLMDTLNFVPSGVFRYMGSFLFQSTYHFSDGSLGNSLGHLARNKWENLQKCARLVVCLIKPIAFLFSWDPLWQGDSCHQFLSCSRFWPHYKSCFFLLYSLECFVGIFPILGASWIADNSFSALCTILSSICLRQKKHQLIDTNHGGWCFDKTWFICL